MAEYSPFEIEEKWQAHWDEHQCFKTPAKPGLKKAYILDMFPYPSGSGLHIGHPLGYTATDIYARFKRMNGFSVLHPMGYDAFGLPAEQHAVNTGEHPSIITGKSCNTFTKQMKRIGFSYDWAKELQTCTPDYYKWTQWIFLKLFNSWFDEREQRARPITELPIPVEVSAKGTLAVEQYQSEHRLAYMADAMVNWCPGLGTVLANEEVIDGRSERGNHEVIRKPMRQWMMRITRYAERLIAELEGLDWPEAIKEQQRNWIGKKHGTEITFEIEGSQRTVTVFTTRPDTLFGVTFMVLSPEHPIVEEITSEAQRSAVNNYRADALKISEFNRTLDTRQKTGCNTGAFAVNPISGDKVPVFIADYVLMTFGTGAVMGVPAHDERDFVFAKNYGLEVRPVVRPASDDAGVISKTLGGEMAWTESGTMLLCEKRVAQDLKLEGKPNTEAAALINDWISSAKKGRVVVSYRLRDWVFSRQRYWGEPIPIIHWEDGSVTAVPEGELPLTLPDVQDFKPSESGESPLAKAGAWLSVTDPVTGRKGRRETNTMPQWAGSCWYYLRFIDAKNSSAAWDPELEKGWMNVDLYVGGAEHAVLHLLYSRFWHKVLFDLGYVSTKEPFQKLFNQGMIQAHAFKDERGVLVPSDEVRTTADGGFEHIKSGAKLERIVAKMSKSLRNVISPDSVIQEFGADTLRMYLMFRGPLDGSGPWDTKAIQGIFRFLRRAWTFVTNNKDQGHSEIVAEEHQPRGVTEAIHAAVKKVTQDIDTLQFNTAVSTLMECLNTISGEPVAKSTLEKFTLLLAPLAPHLSEEMWQRLGHTTSLTSHAWPTYDPALLQKRDVTVVVQTKGKKRATIEVPTDISEERLRELVTNTLATTEHRVTDQNKFIVVYQSGTKVPKLVNIV